MKGKPVNHKRAMLVAGALGVVVLTLPMAACTSSKPQSSGSGETSNGATPARGGDHRYRSAEGR